MIRSGDHQGEATLVRDEVPAGAAAMVRSHSPCVRALAQGGPPTTLVRRPGGPGPMPATTWLGSAPIPGGSAPVTMNRMSPTAPAAPTRGVEFGVSVVPTASEYPQIVEDVTLADGEGLDLVGIQDHPYQRRFLDTFALIGDLLARTERVRFFPDVASLPMRGPFMLAKTAASLDIMSGGRFELGIGAGGFWDAVAGTGGPHRTGAVAADALEEAIPIIRSALVAGSERSVVRAPGPVYPIPGYPAGPPPAHEMAIWVGAYRPRGLRMIGRLADGWVPSLPLVGADGLRDGWELIAEAARGAGRDPAGIRRIVNVVGEVTSGPRGDGPFEGPVDQWVETLTSWTTQPRLVDAVVFWHADRASLERYVGQVVPAVREAIA